jgi:hypothetical protein
MNYFPSSLVKILLGIMLYVCAISAKTIDTADTSVPAGYVRVRPFATRDISVKFKSNDKVIAPLALPSAFRTAAKPIITDIFAPAMWDTLFPNRYGVAASGRNSAAETGGNDFFSYAAFVRACSFFPDFLHNSDSVTQKRELAAFLAHISVETGGLRFSEQLNITQNYSVDNKNYPPVESKTYHGRGPIQLSYNYNYGLFSNYYFGDKNVLLERPEMLLEDAVVSFSSAIWFWMTPQSPKPSCHSVMTGQWQPTDADKQNNRLPGFGLTLNIINAKHCGKNNTSDIIQKRYETYEYICKYLNVDKGENCTCENQVPYGK